MNKKIFFSILVSFGLLATFSSCSKKNNKEGRYIPQKAIAVLHINGASINQKLPWDEIKNTSLFKRMMEDSALPAKIKPLLENPESSGISIKNNVLLYFMSDSLGQYAGAEGVLANADSFEKLVKGDTNGKLNFSESEGMHIGTGNGMALAWNKERFLFVIGIPKQGNQWGANNNPYSSKDSVQDPEESVKDNRNYGNLAKQVFNIKESESLGSDEKFTELVSDNADLHVWINNEELSSSQMSEIPSVGPLSMLNFTKMTKEARATASIHFENGKIVVDFKNFMNKDVADLLAKNLKSHGDADMLKRIPTDNLALLMQFSVNPEIIKGYLKLLGADGFANMGAGMMGFSIDDLIAANAGDFIFSVSNIKADSTFPKADYLFASAIGNKSEFEKVMAGFTKMMKVYNSSPTADSTKEKSKAPFTYNKSEKYFALGSEQPVVDAFLNGEKSNNSPIYDKINSGPGGTYINFNYIMGAMSPLVSDSSTLEILDASKLVWQDMIAYTEKFNGRSLKGHIDINLADKNTNSLKQLNRYFDKLGMIYIQKKMEPKPVLANAMPAETSQY